MNYAPDTIVFLILLVYVFVEEHAMRNWATWAFQGVVVFRRRETNSLSHLQGLRIDRLVAEDVDLGSLGLGVKEASPGLYLAQFLPKPHKWWCSPEGFECPVTCQIRIDYVRGDVEFTARLSTALAVSLSLWFMDMVLSLALARHGADLIFTLLFIPATFLIWYQITFKRRLQDFWFLLATRLHERR